MCVCACVFGGGGGGGGVERGGGGVGDIKRPGKLFKKGNKAERTGQRLISTLSPSASSSVERRVEQWEQSVYRRVSSPAEI